MSGKITKYVYDLKGFLAHHGKHVRKIHDLEALLDAGKTIDLSFESLRDDARFLSQFYVESRYPDDYVEFSREDAEKAYEAALRVQGFVLSKVNPQEQNRGFSALALLAVIAGLVIVVGGGYFVYQRFVKPVDTGETVCTQEAKLCLGGPAVGRTGPNCEFAACPGEIDFVSTWKTYRNEQYGFEVKYPIGWDYLRCGAMVSFVFVANKGVLSCELKIPLIGIYARDLRVERYRQYSKGLPSLKELVAQSMENFIVQKENGLQSQTIYKSKIKIGEIDAVKITGRISKRETFAAGRNSVDIIFAVDNKLYDAILIWDEDASLIDDESNFEQIVSTFKFIK